jgi:hypothetical protein
LRDYGSCGRRASDASGLFVRKLGTRANRGTDGWVYKIGRRAGTAGAGDATGPFGTGRLRSRQEVLWFYCRLRSGGCQRTLDLTVSPRGSVGRGALLQVRARAYDDNGRGIDAPGTVVRLGSAVATTGPGGTAQLAAPARAGRFRITSTPPAGVVPGFPREVVVR